MSENANSKFANVDRLTNPRSKQTFLITYFMETNCWTVSKENREKTEPAENEAMGVIRKIS